MKKLLACLFAAVGIFVFAACGESNGAGETVATVEKKENRGLSSRKKIG